MGVLSADFCKIVHTDRKYNGTALWKRFFLANHTIFFVLPATDKRSLIYTLATCGTDHFVKIWRVFFMPGNVDDQRTGGTRLIPNTPQEHFAGQSSIYSTGVMNASCAQTISAHGSSVTCVRLVPLRSFLSNMILKHFPFLQLQSDRYTALLRQPRQNDQNLEPAGNVP